MQRGFLPPRGSRGRPAAPTATNSTTSNAAYGVLPNAVPTPAGQETPVQILPVGNSVRFAGLVTAYVVCRFRFGEAQQQLSSVAHRTHIVYNLACLHILTLGRAEIRNRDGLSSDSDDSRASDF